MIYNGEQNCGGGKNGMSPGEKWAFVFLYWPIVPLVPIILYNLAEKLF